MTRSASGVPVLNPIKNRSYRLWPFFWHWSALIAEQGSAFTYQLVMHKNNESFARHALRFGGGHIRRGFLRVVIYNVGRRASPAARVTTKLLLELIRCRCTMLSACFSAPPIILLHC
jgi:hypothetical protein